MSAPKSTVPLDNDLFNTKDSFITIIYPREMSQEDYEDFCSYLDIFKRKLARRVKGGDALSVPAQNNTTQGLERLSVDGDDRSVEEKPSTEGSAGNA